MGNDIVLKNLSPQIKREVDLIQSDLLFLILKYNLAIQNNLPASTCFTNQIRRQKPLFVHCLFHAVFGNRSTSNPYVKINIRNSERKGDMLEINTSGSPDTFFSNMEVFCQDISLKEYYIFSGASVVTDSSSPDAIDISPEGYLGSKIRIML